LKNDIAPKNVIPQSSRKSTQSISQGSATISATSGGVVTISMAKVVAVTIIEQLVVPVLLQSCKIQNFSPKVPNGVDQTTAHDLK